MKAAQYRKLKPGDIVLVPAVVESTFPNGTMGSHRGWFSAKLVTGDDGMIGEQKVTLTAHHAELEKKT